MLIIRLAFSNKNFTACISSSSPLKSEIEHTLREYLKHQGNEFDVHPSSKNKKIPKQESINKSMNRCNITISCETWYKKQDTRSTSEM